MLRCSSQCCSIMLHSSLHNDDILKQKQEPWGNMLGHEQEAFSKSYGFCSLTVNSSKAIPGSVFHMSYHFHQRGMQHLWPGYNTVIRQPFLGYTKKRKSSYKKLEIIWTPLFGAGSSGGLHWQLWRTLDYNLQCCSFCSKVMMKCVQNAFWKL